MCLAWGVFKKGVPLVRVWANKKKLLNTKKTKL
jgi:hypothetical protein